MVALDHGHVAVAVADYVHDHDIGKVTGYQTEV
jgi:hypothetical protein